MHCFLEESSSSSSCSFVHIFRSHCVSHLHACFSFQYRLNFASRRTVYVVVGGSLDSRKDSVCNLSNNLIKVQSISLMKLSPHKHAFDVAYRSLAQRRTIRPRSFDNTRNPWMNIVDIFTVKLLASNLKTEPFRPGWAAGIDGILQFRHKIWRLFHPKTPKQKLYERKLKSPNTDGRISNLCCRRVRG